MSTVSNVSRTISTPVTHEELGEAIDLAPTDFLTICLDGKDCEDFLLKITDTRDIKHAYPSSEARYTFAQRFPERREVPGSLGTMWRVPRTDIAAQLINALWPESQRAFENDAAKAAFELALVQLVQQVLAMQNSAKYHEYIKWRNVLVSSGLELDYEAHGLKDAKHTVGEDRIFVNEEGYFCLSYPHDIAPPMPLGENHQGMLHQSVGANNCIDNPGYGLFFEPGTGKTASSIHIIERESEIVFEREKRAYRTLIVVPNNIALNWESEFKEFGRVPGVVVVLRGLVLDRIKLLIEALSNPDSKQYVAVICSYEVMCNMWDYLGAIEWDRSFLDEAHYIKWPFTKRAQFAMKLRDKSRGRTPLTGTPVCNTPIDLYSLLEFMQKGGSGFSSFKAFQDFYGVFEVTDPARGRRKMVDVQNLPFLKERLARMAMIVTRAEALPDLPEITRDVIEVEMTPEQKRIYQDIATKLYAEIENDIANAKDRRGVNADNILVKLLRLAQVTSGFVAYDAVNNPETGECIAPKGIDRIDPNPKIEAMMTLFKDPETQEFLKTPDQKTIIWACWKQDIKTIAARLKLEGIECVQYYGETKLEVRQEAEYRFNHDPKCTVFVGNPGCGGVGLNLIGYPPRQFQYTTNCDHIIYFSQDWSHPKRVQSEMRANRNGTRVPTRCTDLCVRNTIDEEIRARVLNKRTMAMKTQDLREVLAKVLDMDVTV